VELEGTVERQTKRIKHIQTEMNTVNESLESLQIAFQEADLPAIQTAVTELGDAVENLNNAIERIPDYGPATTTTDGLLTAPDKAKLDRITVEVSANLDAIREKLDLITITQPIDLDDLVDRVGVLEGKETEE